MRTGTQPRDEKFPALEALCDTTTSTAGPDEIVWIVGNWEVMITCSGSNALGIHNPKG